MRLFLSISLTCIFGRREYFAMLVGSWPWFMHTHAACSQSCWLDVGAMRISQSGIPRPFADVTKIPFCDTRERPNLDADGQMRGREVSIFSPSIAS